MLDDAPAPPAPAPARHPMLARQLRRHLGATGAIADSALAAFVAAVDAAYRDADREGVVLAHSLETMSAELMTRQEQLQRSAQAYRLLFEHNPIPMWVSAPATGAVLAVNGAAFAHYGYTRDEFAALAPGALLAPPDARAGDDAPAAPHASAEGAGDAPAARVERHRTRAGAVVWAEVTEHAVTWEGAPACLVLAADVTGRRRAEERLRAQAFSDALTGLANRALFRAGVEEALRAPGPRRGPAATVLFLDLDGFKRVNDSLGHAAGDELLVGVAARLRAVVRAGDLVARLGGDEFGVLLARGGDGCDGGAAESGEALADRIVHALAEPLAVGGQEITVAASVGIAAAHAGAPPDALLRDADAAMYAAKAAGRGRWARFHPEMHRRALDRLAVEAELRGALARRELHVAYQPVCDLRTGAVLGAEALARWRHPRLGLVPPSRFIPVAEETGLVAPLGRWVLGEACRQLALWDAAGAPGLTVSVNVSRRQLEGDGLVGDVRAALAAAGVAPERLTLEVTEGSIMRDVDTTLARLRALARLGVRLAVDDFGTGYSSLAYLHRFPVDVLKIDKSFVDGLDAGLSGAGLSAADPDGCGAHAAALVRTVIGLGTSLDLVVVAEGVETAGQRAALAALGCRQGQGYLFGRPAAAEVVGALARGAAPGAAAAA